MKWEIGRLVGMVAIVIALAGLVLMFAPQWTVVVLWVFTVVNGGFLLASIAFSARAALRASH